MRKCIDEAIVQKRMKSRLLSNKIFKVLFLLATLFGLAFLAVLIYRVFDQGIAWIDWNFLTGRQSNDPDRAGIMGAILGTSWLMLVVIPVTIFVGVGTAIYIELYAKKGKFQKDRKSVV